AEAQTRRGFRAVVVTGAAGIGKTRLFRELATIAHDDATVLTGRCFSYGENATFQPLLEALGSREQVVAALEGEPDAATIASGLGHVWGGGGATAPAEEVPWAFRRYCEIVAGRSPVVLALDDLQWAAPALLDLIEYLAGSPAAVPIVCVCIARDELA